MSQFQINEKKIQFTQSNKLLSNAVSTTKSHQILQNKCISFTYIIDNYLQF